MTLVPSIAAAYDATGEAWCAGPAKVYARLADVLCDVLSDALPRRRLAGTAVLDLGAGTGAASDALRGRGAAVVALDVSLGMLRARPDTTVPAVAADACHLPFADASFDGVLAAFSLNHLVDPAAALREVARVLRPGGAAVVAAYGEDDTHPAKDAVRDAVAAAGWTPPAWEEALRTSAMPALATPRRAVASAHRAGIASATADRLEVVLADLSVADLVSWRLGMPQVAPFVASLDADARARVRADAVERLGSDPPPLVRRVVALSWTAAAAKTASAGGPPARVSARGAVTT